MFLSSYLDFNSDIMFISFWKFEFIGSIVGFVKAENSQLHANVPILKNISLLKFSLKYVLFIFTAHNYDHDWRIATN